MFIFICLVTSIQSQEDDAYIHFDDSSYLNFIEIDSISNPNNIWQVGTPNKNNFIGAVTPPNVIVTDTVNPYPINDTSSFYIHYVASYVPGGWTGTSLQIEYRIDSDIGNDYGYVEFSPDNGLTWVNYMTDTIYNDCYYMYDTVFTGFSEDWEYASYYNNPWCFNMQFGDSMMYRITFISDSIQSNRDGWMIDNIDLYDVWEGVDDHTKTLKFHIFPNPATSSINIISDIDLNGCNAHIYNQIGQLVSSTNLEQNSIPVTSLQSGLYILGIMTDKGEIRRKFIVHK
jgi:hypothetical protein